MSARKRQSVGTGSSNMTTPTSTRSTRRTAASIDDTTAAATNSSSSPPLSKANGALTPANSSRKRKSSAPAPDTTDAHDDTTTALSPSSSPSALSSSEVGLECSPFLADVISSIEDYTADAVDHVEAEMIRQSKALGDDTTTDECKRLTDDLFALLNKRLDALVDRFEVVAVENVFNIPRSNDDGAGANTQSALDEAQLDHDITTLTERIVSTHSLVSHLSVEASALTSQLTSYEQHKSLFVTADASASALIQRLSDVSVKSSELTAALRQTSGAISEQETQRVRTAVEANTPHNITSLTASTAASAYHDMSTTDLKNFIHRV